MRTQEEILADLNEARKEYELAEAEFTHSNKDEIDPDQEVADNPTEEMIEARDRLEMARDRLERLREEYDLYLIYQSGAQGGDEVLQ
jgi:hypothetical protein